MADFVERIIIDDTDAIQGLKNVESQAGKTAKEYEDLTRKVQQGTKKMSDSQKQLGKAVNEATTEQKKSKEAAMDVARALVMSGDGAVKFNNILTKLEAASLKGIAVDVNDVEAAFIDVFEAAKLTDQQIKVLEGDMEGVVQALGDLQVDEIQKMAKESDKLVNGFKSAKSELTQLKNQISSGQLSGKELEEATKRAAMLEDEIGDVRGQIKLMASDTRNLDLTIEALGGLAAGFQIVEGAAALYGDESKELQESLVRLNAIMVVANGLQQASELIQKRGGIATLIAAKAQGVYNMVVGQSSGALKVFRLALASTGIGLLVIALGALITNFDAVKKKVLEFIPALTKVGSFVIGVKDAIVSLFQDAANIIGSFFSGDFSEAYAKAKQVGANMAKNFNAGFEENERDKANKKLADEVENLAKTQKKRAEVLAAGGKDSYNELLKATQNELKALKLRNDDKEKIAEKEHELDVMNAERQKKLNDEAEKRRQDAIKKRQELLKEFEGMQKELVTLMKDSDLLSEEEKFNLVKEQDLKGLQMFRMELEKTAKQLGVNVVKELQQVDQLIKSVTDRKFTKFTIFNDAENDQFNINQLLEGVKKRRVIQLQEIEDSIFSDETKAELKKEILLRSELEQLKIIQEFGDKSSLAYEENNLRIIEIQNELVKQEEQVYQKRLNELDRFLQDVNSFEDLFAKAWESLIPGAEEGEGEAFLQAARATISAFGSLIAEGQQIQLNAIDEQLKRLSDRRSTLESELDKELQLREEGLANNVDTKKIEVDQLIAEETRLSQERDKIAKRAELNRLRADTAQQASALITSAIEIYKGFSVIPFGLGIPLAIAAISGMFALFAKTKVEAFKAARLYTGAEKISDHFGYVDKHGETDLPGRGDGYSLINNKTGRNAGVIISGREMLIPEYISQEHEMFFNSLRNGLYSGIDLNAAIGFYKQFKGKAAQSIIQPKITLQNEYKQANQRQFIPLKNGKWSLVTITPEMKDGTIIET